MMTFGERLRNARLDKGMKQADVAEMLDCASTSLTNWENDKVQPPLGVLSKLCEVYGISPLSLLDRTFEYGDIFNIACKPVYKRTYEEQIALNFSEPILGGLLTVDKQRKETERVEAMAAFLQDTDLLNRFGGSMEKEDMEAVKADYDAFGGADVEILFAFHALTKENKEAFLSMLGGLLSDRDGLRAITGIDKAQAFTLGRLAAQRDAIRKGG